MKHKKTATMPSSSTGLNPPLSAPNFNVAGRVFVITGGSQGLGKAIAKVLKGQGASGLVLVSRSADKGMRARRELDGDGCTCVWIEADLSQSEQASAMISKAVEVMKFVGPISGVVNAAATTARGNLFTTTADDFDRQMAINVRAPFLITQAAAKHMIDSGVQGGSIVNIASVAAHGGAPFIMVSEVVLASCFALLHEGIALTITTARHILPPRQPL